MTENELETHYRGYIHCLNDRRLDELDKFVHEKLTYNGRSMTRLDYQDLIAGNIAALPDLSFDTHRLVSNGNQIACRLNFECTPRSAFLGPRPSGKSISFSEHVFYGLRDGKSDEACWRRLRDWAEPGVWERLQRLLEAELGGLELIGEHEAVEVQETQTMARRRAGQSQPASCHPSS